MYNYENKHLGYRMKKILMTLLIAVSLFAEEQPSEQASSGDSLGQVALKAILLPVAVVGAIEIAVAETIAAGIKYPFKKAGELISKSTTPETQNENNNSESGK